MCSFIFSHLWSNHSWLDPSAAPVQPSFFNLLIWLKHAFNVLWKGKFCVDHHASIMNASDHMIEYFHAIPVQYFIISKFFFACYSISHRWWISNSRLIFHFRSANQSTGLMAVVINVVKNEHLSGLWKGVIPVSLN